MQSNRSIAMLFFGISVLALAACGGSGGSEEAAVVDEAKNQTTSESAVLLRELEVDESELIETIASVAKAIEAAPERAALILAEHDLSPEAWTSTLESIARDPALSAAYETAMGR